MNGSGINAKSLLNREVVALRMVHTSVRYSQ